MQWPGSAHSPGGGRPALPTPAAHSPSVHAPHLGKAAASTTSQEAPPPPCCDRAAVFDGMPPRPVPLRAGSAGSTQQPALVSAFGATAASACYMGPGLTSASDLRLGPAVHAHSAPTGAGATGHDGPPPGPQPNSVNLILAAMLGLPTPAAGGLPLPLSWQASQAAAARAQECQARQQQEQRLAQAAAMQTQWGGLQGAVNELPAHQTGAARTTGGLHFGLSSAASSPVPARQQKSLAGDVAATGESDVTLRPAVHHSLQVLRRHIEESPASCVRLNAA